MEIKDGLIQRVELYARCSWATRWDVAPFLLCYTLLFAGAIVDFMEAKFSFFVAIPVVICIHLLLFLVAQSSVQLRCWIGKSKVKDFMTADFVLVYAAKNAGKDKIVSMEHNIPKQSNSSTVISSGVSVSFRTLGKSYSLADHTFQYQEVTYYYDTDRKLFVRLDYPVENDVKTLLTWFGFDGNDNIISALRRWGPNEFNIPMPHFLDLYMEHLVAPFFVFQVVCLFLWSLDDYWYYSVFTLFMLMLFEGVMCKQRQNNVLMMRSMRREAFAILVYRNQKWNIITSDMLVPGDIVSITSDTVLVNKQQPKPTNEDERVVPCDILLLRGSCVVNEAMLTGESIPKMKEHIGTTASDLIEQGKVDLMKDSKWARHIVLGGTQLQQHTSAEEDANGIPAPPDRGCIGVVIRTGFATTQGELMRKILFATEGAAANASETFAFIFILVCCAFVAAVIVLRDGMYDERRNKFRLALHCIMIITSVVPPELPMELSLAVTNSLTALAKQMIYCTESFRIPWAGKLNVICFDKTGTLTKDEMMLKGVVAAQDVDIITGSLDIDNSEMSTDMISAETTTDMVQCIMGTCHDLIIRMNEQKQPAPMGDPMELAAFNSSGFSFVLVSGAGKGSGNVVACVNNEMKVNVNTLQQFPFSSDLKRMSVVTDLRKAVEDDHGVFNHELVRYVFCKGAPEVLQSLLATVPTDYASIYRHHMQAGKRVIAVAYKTLKNTTGTIAKLTRQDAECDLLFAGFLVFDSDLKADSKGVIKELQGAKQNVVMITGDSVYTAVSVGKRLMIIDRSKKSTPTLLLLCLETTENSGKSSSSKSKSTSFGKVWRRIDAKTASNEDPLATSHRQVDDIDFDLTNLDSLAKDNSLCVIGSTLDIIAAQSKHHFSSVLKVLVPHVKIFARVSPQQKEKIILAFNESGHFTLMCGDGTNDVGALKAAHVGVSIINNPKLESKVEKNGSGESNKKGGGSSVKDRAARALMELQENEQDPSLVKLGDASIASPFTTKRTSVDSVLAIIRQGRCTLVTTIQVYKVLALNCLASAYMMSSLYMKGLKQGDMQMTASGVLIAALFFFLSQAKPLLTVSDHAPPSSVFNPAVYLSIIGQCLVHLACMAATVMLCEQYTLAQSFSMSPDGKFTPNLINSTMFILANLMQVNNFWVNYRGAPFMEPLTSNVYYYRSLQAVYVIALIVIGGQFEPANDFLQLVMLPAVPDFQVKFLGILGADALLAFTIEHACRRLE